MLKGVEPKVMDPPKTVNVISLIITTSGPENGAVTGGRIMVVVAPPALIVRGSGFKLLVRAKVEESTPDGIGTLKKLITEGVTVMSKQCVSCLLEFNLLGKGDIDVIVEPPSTKRVEIGAKLIIVDVGTDEGGSTKVQGGKQLITGLGSTNIIGSIKTMPLPDVGPDPLPSPSPSSDCKSTAQSAVPKKVRSW